MQANPQYFIDLMMRSTTAYLAEGFIGLVLFCLFLYYAERYKRHFLKIWAFSWAAFFVSMMFLAFVTYNWKTPYPLINHLASYCYIVANIIQVFLLLAGSYELVKRKQLSATTISRWLLAIGVLGALIVLPYMWDNEMANVRYLLRVGLRYGIVIAGFTVAAYVTLYSPRSASGVGKKLVSGSFFLYGFYHVYYLGIVLSNAFFTPVTFPVFFGLIEVVLVSMVGLSMVIWLLEEEHENLKKTNQELDDFIYRISHDLRSPIATALAVTNLAKLEVNDAQSVRYMSMIAERLLKLDSVIFDILALVRNKSSEMKFQEIDFNAVIHELVTDLKLAHQPTGILFDYATGSGNSLYTDYAILKTVLRNLIDNAIKYHNHYQDHPYIKISFTRTAKTIQIVVLDNGQGIPEESLGRIFNMFYRAHTGTEGTGLGLYIVAQGLAKIDGTISVRSAFGQGSSFSISLPA